MSGRAGQMGKESLSVDGTEPLSDVGSNMPGTPNQNLSKLFEMLNSSKPGLIKKNNSIVAQKPPSVKVKDPIYTYRTRKTQILPLRKGFKVEKV